MSKKAVGLWAGEPHAGAAIEDHAAGMTAPGATGHTLSRRGSSVTFDKRPPPG